jgi:hypothetical protein
MTIGPVWTSTSGSYRLAATPRDTPNNNGGGDRLAATVRRAVGQPLPDCARNYLYLCETELECASPSNQVRHRLVFTKLVMYLYGPSNILPSTVASLSVTFSRLRRDPIFFSSNRSDIFTIIL